MSQLPLEIYQNIWKYTFCDVLGELENTYPTTDSGDELKEIIPMIVDFCLETNRDFNVLFVVNRYPQMRLIEIADHQVWKKLSREPDFPLADVHIEQYTPSGLSEEFFLEFFKKHQYCILFCVEVSMWMRKYPIIYWRSCGH